MHACSLNHNFNQTMSSDFFTRICNWWTQKSIYSVTINDKCRKTDKSSCNHDVFFLYWGDSKQETKLIPGEYIYDNYYSYMSAVQRDHFHDIKYPKYAGMLFKKPQQQPQQQAQHDPAPPPPSYEEQQSK